MCTVAIDDFHSGMKSDILAKYLKNRLPLYHSSPQCVLGLKAYDEDCVPWIACSLRQMMKDSPIFHHARCGDYSHGAMSTRYCLRLLHIAGVVEQVEPKEFLGLLHHFFGPVEAFRVHLEHGGCIDCQRA